ncbi:MAG: hypothetical protein HN909_08050 [Phycisphaerales bacterium]|nr:hypothetical protein [Phycisphaerales bacterium]MBT7171708.1 hypothetical protein [Phycisphaerales bacterium]
MTLALGSMLACALIAGCGACDDGSAGHMSQAPVAAVSSSATSQAASPPAPLPRPMATVNGKVVPMARLHRALVEDYGLAIAQQIIADEVVDQELIKRKLPTAVTEEEVKAESLDALDQIFKLGNTKTTPKELEGLLKQFLVQQKFTRRQWDQAMTRNVRLRRLVVTEIKLTEAELHNAFVRLYGGTWQIRHIQVASRVQAMKIYRAVNAGGDFAQQAKAFSTAPSRAAGGLRQVPMNKPPKDLPPLVIQSIGSLAAGKVSSPMLANKAYHIIKLEKILPPEKLKLEEKRAELTALLIQVETSRRRQQLLAELVRDAKIEYLDPTVKTQHETFQANSKKR